jgi:DNA polymerase III subunit gamma/tau
MQYQALYRKYRPSTFDDVVGQDVIIKTIKNSIKEKKVSHAYLFCGPRGTGKTSVAKLVAKNINCENPIDGNACGSCNFCKQFDNKETQDIIEIDAASNNGVDEIREIRNKINFTPTVGKYKIYIVDEVHMLSIGAFNALLKTLEEPPAHIIFILATTESHKVPLTIVSRCQRFDFKKITNHMIKKRIEHIVNVEKIEIDDDAILEIARLSDGGLRDAIGMLDQLISFSNKKIAIEDVQNINGTISKKQMLELLIDCFNNNITRVFNQIDNYNQQGKDLIKLSEELMIILRDILLIKNICDYFSKDKYLESLYLDNEKYFDENNIYKWIKELNGTLNDMKNSNHPKILLETMLIKLYNQNESSIKNIDIQQEFKIDNVEKTAPINNIESTSLDEVEKLEKKQLNTANKINNEEFINVRINNAFANADKKVLSDLKNNWLNIASYSVDEYFGPLAGMLLDAEVKVAGECYLLIAYTYDSMVERFNEIVDDVEVLIEKVFGKKIKVIAVLEKNWEKLKKEYVNNTKDGKKYELLEDVCLKKNSEIKDDVNNEEDLIKSAINIFGDNIVEIR